MKKPFFMLLAFVTGSAISVSAQAVGKKQTQALETAQSSVSTASADAKVWVVRPDGAQSCGTKEGQALTAMSEELKKTGVQVLDARKGNDGKLHMQMCGAPTGSFNGFLIPAADLPKALAIGFKEAPQGFPGK